MTTLRRGLVLVVLAVLPVIGCSSDNPTTVPGSKGHTNGRMSTSSTAPSGSAPGATGRSTGG